MNYKCIFCGVYHDYMGVRPKLCPRSKPRTVVVLGKRKKEERPSEQNRCCSSPSCFNHSQSA